MVPAGPPGSEETRMKTLNEIEPRSVVTNLPFAITNSGCYYLTKSLQGKNFADGITISTNEVKLDLNGYSMNGTTGSYSAIKVVGPCENISIRNGVIRRWGNFAVDAASASDVVVQEIKVFNCGWGGIYVGPNSRIDTCSLFGNGFNDPPPTEPPSDDAIQAGSFATITECKIRGNRGAGIHTYMHSKIIGCTSVGSKNADGIRTEDYCTVRDCVSSQNKSHGIRVASQCRVIGNTCGENGTNATPPDYVGGISVEGMNNYVANNSIAGNHVGLRLFGSGNLIVHNTACKNIAMDFWWPPGPQSNFVGQISTMTQGSQFSTNNAWGNFSFRSQ